MRLWLACLLGMIATAAPAALPPTSDLSYDTKAMWIESAKDHIRSLAEQPVEFHLVTMGKSSPRMRPVVCGYAKTSDDLMFIQFIVQPSTGGVFFDDGTLHFNETWMRRCSAWAH